MTKLEATLLFSAAAPTEPTFVLPTLPPKTETPWLTDVPPTQTLLIKPPSADKSLMATATTVARPRLILILTSTGDNIRVWMGTVEGKARLFLHTVVISDRIFSAGGLLTSALKDKLTGDWKVALKRECGQTDRVVIGDVWNMTRTKRPPANSVRDSGVPIDDWGPPPLPAIDAQGQPREKDWLTNLDETSCFERRGSRSGSGLC